MANAAEGHHSRCWEWPAVLMGNFGGTLKSGRYLELPGHGGKDVDQKGGIAELLA